MEVGQRSPARRLDSLQVIDASVRSTGLALDTEVILVGYEAIPSFHSPYEYFDQI